MLPGNVPKTKKENRDYFSRAAEGGAAAGVGVSANSQPGTQKTVLTFKNAPLALIDTAGVVARCALKVLDFPEGLIQVFGAVVNLTLVRGANGVNADFDGDVSLGSVAAAGDATLTGTEANVVPSTPTPQAVAGATTAKAQSTAGVLLDGTATAVDLYLNVLVDDVDQDVTTTPTSLIANGTITVLWANLGDK